MNTARNERARSSYLRVLVSIQKWIGGTAGDASVPLSISSLPLRPARVHGVGEADISLGAEATAGENRHRNSPPTSSRQPCCSPFVVLRRAPGHSRLAIGNYFRTRRRCQRPTTGISRTASERADSLAIAAAMPAKRRVWSRPLRLIRRTRARACPREYASRRLSLRRSIRRGGTARGRASRPSACKRVTH